MNFAPATPSAFPHPFRLALVVGALVLLVLLGFTHSYVLRAVIRERHDAERRFRAKVEQRAGKVEKRLLETEVALMERARSDLVARCAQTPTADNLAGLRQALAPLADPQTGPFSQILLVDGDNRILTSVGAADTTSLASFMSLTGDRDGRSEIGFMHSDVGSVRLVMANRVPGPESHGARLVCLFDPGLTGLLGNLDLSDGGPAGFAVALMETGALVVSNPALSMTMFSPLLGSEGGFCDRILADLGAVGPTELAGCWLLIGDSPLVFAQLVPREEAVGFSAPSLVIASAVISGGLVFALVAMLFIIAWQHDRAVREHVELARLDLELQEKLGEAKRAEEDTRRLTRAFESAGEPVMVTDRWGVLEYVNHAFERLLGFSAEDVVGKRLVDLVPPDEAQRLQPMIARSRRAFWSRRIRCRHRDGERLRLDVTVAPVRDEKRKSVVGYIVLARDVRGDMRLEERALQARKLEAVGRLAGGLAHDFNNVLQIILGYAGELMESAEHPELQDSLSQILAAGRLGSELTSRLIAFSRQQVSHREPSCANEAVRSCAHTIQKRLGGNVDLQLALAPKLWNALLDQKRIEQVLVQLAENARDAMPNGGTITIGTANVTQREPLQTVTLDLPGGDYVRIEVGDNGRGMPPEDLEQIFEPLFTTQSQGGLKGLGLCVVHGTIAQHGGGIIVESVPGRGTVFRIYLPRTVDAASETEEDTSEILVAQLGEGRTILLAEDEEPVRHVAARLLAKAGYEVVEAVDGKDAIAKFSAARERIDLALLDIVMPEVSGAVVANHIRQTSPTTPILFCSGYAKHQLPDGIDLPEDIPLIGKPYEPRRLMDAIAALLDK